jgi:hypothetical protein
MDKPKPFDPHDAHGIYKAADKVFRSDKHPVAKILVAAGLGLMLSLVLALKVKGMTAMQWCISTVVICGTFSSIATLFLLVDRTQRRIKNGERVGLIARVLFGAGMASALIWVLIAIGIGFPLAIWLGGRNPGRATR